MSIIDDILNRIGLGGASAKGNVPVSSIPTPQPVMQSSIPTPQITVPEVGSLAPFQSTPQIPQNISAITPITAANLIPSAQPTEDDDSTGTSFLGLRAGDFARSADFVNNAKDSLDDFFGSLDQGLSPSDQFKKAGDFFKFGLDSLTKESLTPRTDFLKGVGAGLLQGGIVAPISLVGEVIGRAVPTTTEQEVQKILDSKQGLTAFDDLGIRRTSSSDVVKLAGDIERSISQSPSLDIAYNDFIEENPGSPIDINDFQKISQSNKIVNNFKQEAQNAKSISELGKIGLKNYDVEKVWEELNSVQGNINADPATRAQDLQIRAQGIVSDTKKLQLFLGPQIQQLEEAKANNEGSVPELERRLQESIRVANSFADTTVELNKINAEMGTEGTQSLIRKEILSSDWWSKQKEKGTTEGQLDAAIGNAGGAVNMFFRYRAGILPDDLLVIASRTSPEEYMRGELSEFNIVRSSYQLQPNSITGRDQSVSAGDKALGFANLLGGVYNIGIATPGDAIFDTTAAAIYSDSFDITAQSSVSGLERGVLGEKRTIEPIRDYAHSVVDVAGNLVTALIPTIKNPLAIKNISSVKRVTDYSKVASSMKYLGFTDDVIAQTTRGLSTAGDTAILKGANLTNTALIPAAKGLVLEPIFIAIDPEAGSNLSDTFLKWGALAGIAIDVAMPLAKSVRSSALASSRNASSQALDLYKSQDSSSRIFLDTYNSLYETFYNAERILKKSGVASDPAETYLKDIFVEGVINREVMNELVTNGILIDTVVAKALNEGAGSSAAEEIASKLNQYNIDPQTAERWNQLRSLADDQSISLNNVLSTFQSGGADRLVSLQLGARLSDVPQVIPTYVLDNVQYLPAGKRVTDTFTAAQITQMDELGGAYKPASKNSDNSYKYFRKVGDNQYIINTSTSDEIGISKNWAVDRSFDDIGAISKDESAFLEGLDKVNQGDVALGKQQTFDTESIKSSGTYEKLNNILSINCP